MLAKANLWIATGERVLIELGSFRAESFEQLFDGVMKLPLENFIGRKTLSLLRVMPSIQSFILSLIVRR